MADVVEKPLDGTQNPGQVPTEKPAAQVAEDSVDPKVQELINQRRHANKEAVEAKKRADAFEAELKAIKDKEKTDAQRITEENATLKARLDQQEKANAQQARINAALKLGATDSDYIAWKIETDKIDINDPEAMDGIKKALPHLFGQAQKPAPASGAGGPGASNPAQQKKAAQIEAYKKAIAVERDDNQKIYLKRALKALEAQA